MYLILILSLDPFFLFIHRLPTNPALLWGSKENHLMYMGMNPKIFGTPKQGAICDVQGNCIYDNEFIIDTFKVFYF